jgi:hypothetical protein
MIPPEVWQQWAAEPCACYPHEWLARAAVECRSCLARRWLAKRPAWR